MKKHSKNLTILKELLSPRYLKILAILLFGSAIMIWYTWSVSKQNIITTIKNNAQIIEVALNDEALKSLNALPTDTGLNTYKEIKNKLINILKFNSNAEFLYIYKLKNNKVVFMIDSEPDNSENCSPPGQEYTEADSTLFSPFNTGRMDITKPSKDRWGNWVSVLIPIKDNNGKVYAVLGIDYPASIWLQTAKTNILILVLFLFFINLLFIVSFLFIRKNSQLNRATKANNETHAQMVALKAAIDQIDDIIGVKDLNLKVVATNSAFLKVTGKKSMNELIGKTDAEIYNVSEEQEPIKTYMNDERHAQTLGVGEYILKEEDLILPNGEVRIILTKKFPVYNEKNELIFTGNISRDITQRKKIEADLKIKEERYIDAQKIGKTGHWEFDLEKNKLYWSSQTYEIYEQDPSVFVPTFDSIMELYHPDDREYILAEYNYCLETKNNLNIETRIITPSGSVKYAMQRAKVECKGSDVVLVIGSIADITEQKYIEIELKKSKELAEAASVAKSDFLSNMSHEIRTPLNGVIGFTELLRGTSLDSTQREYLDNAIVCANSLLNVISDILDFSKIEAGKLDLEMVRTDLVQLLESATDIVKVHAANKNIELLLSIQQNIPRFAIVDPIRLKQMLINLMSNAVKFTQNGEVELKMTFEMKDETVGYFTLSVRDTGVGVKDADKSKLFKAFSQADTSTTRRYGGTGLGLIISNSLAQKMGSKIHFDSEYGKGSTFFFTLETSYELNNQASNIPSKSIQRVLVIDDNINNRNILKHTLNYWGIEFVGCESGLDGIAMLEKSPSFDLLIVDYHMPGIDGIETIKRIRQDCRFTPENQSIIMLHSSSDDVEIHNAARELNIQYSLTKPVKSDELYGYLQNIHDYRSESVVIDDVKEEKSIQFDSEVKILIAEDNLMNMMVITHMLKNLLPNVQFFEANNGEEVIELLKTNIPDIVLMDVQMPEMDGIEATKRIRSNACSTISSLPIVALTAGVSKDERENCYNAGMNYFLSKPIENKSLEEMVTKFINKDIPLTNRIDE